MLWKTMSVTIVALMVCAPLTLAQATDAVVAYAPAVPQLSLAVGGSYPIGPGELGVASNSPVTLDLSFNHEIDHFCVAVAPWATSGAGPWIVFALGLVPPSQAVSFPGTVPSSMIGCSFAVVLAGRTTQAQCVVLDPVIVHVN